MSPNFKTGVQQALTALILLTIFFCTKSYAQRVENKGCPNSYFRNNGNGQAVTVFAPNITPTSVYALSALSNSSQGNFTFKWDINIVNPPVINRTWVTSTSSVTSLNWTFGNNTSGSPINPPGIPVGGDVKYTFYNINLPTAGVITLELIDPYDGSYVNTCSYPLSSGASSTGLLTSLAVAPPSDFVYAISNSSTISGIEGNSVSPTVNAAGGTILYSISPAVTGISVNASTGIITWASNTPSGTHHLTVKASNGVAPDATTSYTLTVTDNGVGSGTDGGLESKSLGNIVAERMFHNVIREKPSNVDYSKTLKIGDNLQYRISSSDIKKYMPDQSALGTGFTGFITSPSDILSFTNAKNVVSVDYVQNGINKAVAFCTETRNAVYTHTKPVCDRLKGAELITVDTINYGNYKFLRYYLKPVNGLNEYAISFSVGYDPADQNYTLQSEWITDQYEGQDVMYNFQLWSSDAGILNHMLVNVLQKLQADMPIQQKGMVKKPVVFITKAQRNDKDQRSLQLTVTNSSAQASVWIIVTGKANEQSSNTITKAYPFILAAKSNSVVDIAVDDMAESEIRLMVSGVNEDFIYSNDGIWNIYKTAGTSVHEFLISNDTIQPGESEYRMFRNIKLKATTPDYITVYRMLKGGGMPADLSSFSFLKFTASGNGKVRIRLIKKSVTNFDQQYEYELPLLNTPKDYCINIKDFKSIGSALTIAANDVTIISFTYETQGSVSLIETRLSNVRFSNMGIYTENTFLHTINAYPNPAKDMVSLQFQSLVAEKMNLKLVHVSGDQVIMQQTVNVTQGMNQMNIHLPAHIKTGVYIIQLQSAVQLFQTRIIKIN
ncbi:MAG: T9SS type A sorting domain-containing protein [Chitinophagaceae bacterium]|nr:T9SS type A sorting domain-containing protein [Chitinophagaceae bacterium]